MKYTIAQVATIIDGDRGVNYPKQNEFKSDGYCLFLNTGNVTQDGFSFDSNQFITNEKDQLLRKGKLQRGDIVYTTRGTIGNAAFYSDKVPFDNIRINSGMVILRCKKEIIDVRYLYQVLKSSYYRPYFRQYCTGSAQPQLPIKDLSKIVIDIPDLNTQERIASILSAYDELIETNRRQIKLLEEAAQRLYKEWFVHLRFPGWEDTKIVDGVPEGWRWVNFTEVVPIVTGKKDANFGTPDGNFLFFTCAQTPIKAPSYSFDCSAVILAGNGDFNVKLYRGKFEAYQRTYVLSPNKNEHLHILYNTVRENMARLFQGASGSTIKFLTKHMLEEIKILIPSDALLETYNQISEFIQNKIECLSSQIVLSSESRDRLLPKLMTGEIEV